MKGKDLLELTPQAAMVCQAKIVTGEKVLQDWIASPQGKVEYLLLHHRVMSIVGDVIRPIDKFISYDLAGPPWVAGKADHLAWDQSWTSRQHETRGRKSSLLTRAPTILETSELSK